MSPLRREPSQGVRVWLSVSFISDLDPASGGGHTARSADLYFRRGDWRLDVWPVYQAGAELVC